MKKLLLLLIFSTSASFSQCLTSLNTRYAHTVGLKPDGTLWAWGWGGFGQLNNGGEENIYVPGPISPLTTWQWVAAERFSTFAIKTDGTLWACGGNEFGSLGIGYAGPTVQNFTQVGTGNNWKQVAPSQHFTIGLKTDNTLWGWGQNDAYQVGDGTITQRNSPVQISTDTDWRMVATNLFRVGFALKQDGTLWGWGLNSAALLGDNLVSGRSTPTLHNPDTDWDTISLGLFHILALKTNGTLWAWGGGNNGETADGMPLDYNRYLPRQIGTDNNWQTIAAGDRFSMAIKTDGTLWAWGLNDVGQLGDGTTVNKLMPVQIGTDTNWESISCGWQHSVAQKTDGTMYTWGTNVAGQLGNGTTDTVTFPTHIPIEGCTLGINEVVTSNVLLLSPNPAKDFVAVNYSGIANSAAIELFDLTGRSLVRHTIVEGNGEWLLPTAQYPSGVYIVVVNAGNGIKIQQKLVIQ